MKIPRSFRICFLVAGEMSKITVLERFRSLNKTARGFACGVNDLIAGPGATVKYPEFARNVGTAT